MLKVDWEGCGILFVYIIEECNDDIICPAWAVHVVSLHAVSPRLNLHRCRQLRITLQNRPELARTSHVRAGPLLGPAYKQTAN